MPADLLSCFLHYGQLMDHASKSTNSANGCRTILSVCMQATDRCPTESLVEFLLRIHRSVLLRHVQYTGTPSLFTESIGIYISDSLSTGVRVCECCGVGMLHCRVYVCGRFHHKKAVVLKVLASIHRQMYNCVFNSTFMVLTHKL